MSGPFTSRYRVFISYSHSDEPLVRRLEEILAARGLVPMRDKHFAYGVGFHGQIQRFIEHAHVFMPVITDESSRRGWVQQEIGFAMAQNVPVLPIAIARTPGEWLQSLHAIVLNAPQSSSPEDIDAAIAPLEQILSAGLNEATPRLIDKLISDYSEERFARFACAYLQEDRTAAITRYANDVYSIQVSFPGLPQDRHQPGKDYREFALSSYVRQKGGLSSFHIPDLPLTHEDWKLRYGRATKSEHHCSLQRGERQALERHAAEWGARIIIDPTLKYGGYGKQVRPVRLRRLLEFLQSPKVANLEVAINTRMSFSESVTILGSWYLAQSVTANAGQGYYQTILTRHAPSMQARIAAFDEEFATLLEECGWTAADSRARAVEEVERELRECSAPLRPRKIPQKG